MRFQFAAVAALIAATACSRPPVRQPSPYSDRHDYHSFSNPDQVRVRHVHLDFEADFAAKRLQGSATLTFDRTGSDRSAPLLLDTRDLTIARAEYSTDGVTFQTTAHSLGQSDKILGAPLTITIPPAASQVRVFYQTSPSATGLQWVAPEGTAGKKHPFLYTQSQAIHARSWMPVQDTPGVRVTYSATVRVPKPLLAVMSARQDTLPGTRGEYKFSMPQAIPAYLIALAIGDLQFQAISARAGVYAEPPVLPLAARELEDLEKIIQAAEALYGVYRWERYDVLFLPPSFPYGGMENPRLTFASTTMLAGDKSMIGLISHELAHSWSGNLVTNATWRDFWLNEGFTTYFERRIQEAVYGQERSEMEAYLERAELEREMATLDDRDEVLYIDLKGRDPDEGSTSVPYMKGMLLLRKLEETFTRDRFDPFLRGYFDSHAFQSITTGDFVDYLRKHLFEPFPELAKTIDLEEWLTRPGLPRSAPQPKSEAFDRVAAVAREWLEGRTPVAGIPWKQWSMHERMHFLTSLPEDLPAGRMGELDRAFGLTSTGNASIASQWLLMAVRSSYKPAYARLESFLTGVGRRKYIVPIYTELAKTPDGKKRALAIYRKAAPGYHPISAISIQQILGAKKQ